MGSLREEEIVRSVNNALLTCDALLPFTIPKPIVVKMPLPKSDESTINSSGKAHIDETRNVVCRENR